MKILQKRKKRLVIFTQGIFPPILKKIRTLVAELQVLTDRQTDTDSDRPTTRHGNRSSGPNNCHYTNPMVVFPPVYKMTRPCPIPHSVSRVELKQDQTDSAMDWLELCLHSVTEIFKWILEIIHQTSKYGSTSSCIYETHTYAELHTMKENMK